jgi:hypothetical protein
MSVSSLNSSYKTAGTRAPEFVSRIDDSTVNKGEDDTRNIRVDCLTVNRLTISFFEIRKVRYETFSGMVYVQRRGMKKVKSCYTLLSKKSVPVS